jgi:hypothetical protein
MTIETDISVAANGDIRYTGSTANFTVIEFHRFLQDLADDAVASGDDLLDITNDTPSERSTDNIITLNSPFNIDDTLAEHIYDGSIAQAAGAIVYAGLVVVGSVPVGTNLQIVQNNTILTNYWGVGINANAAANILLRIMVKVRDAGADIDGRRLRVQARELGDTYGEFSLSTALGNNTAAIFTAVDLNNPTIAGTIAGWSTIVNGEGYQGLDVSGDGSVEFYYSKWELGVQGINDLYERTKWITRRGTAETIHGLNGELFRGITHEVSYDGQDASEFFTEDEVVTFGNGATAIILGDSEAGVDSGVTGKMYVQLLTGTAPSDNDTIAGLSCNALVVGSPVTRTVKPEFIGASTGSAIIGNYGIGIDPTDLTASDQLFDLTNSLIVPPNNVSFTVSGLVSGEDRILVGPENAGSILVAQLSISGTLSGGEATVVVNEAIPSDTPSTGTIRILKDDGVYERVTYTGFSASSFTGCANVPAASDATNCFISYIDTLAGSTQESFTTVYNASRSLFIRVRDGGATPIKTFETTGNLGSAGGSSTAIRSSDA